MFFPFNLHNIAKNWLEKEFMKISVVSGVVEPFFCLETTLQLKNPQKKERFYIKKGELRENRGDVSTKLLNPLNIGTF